MELIRPFAKIGKDDAGIAGGKGASLGEMTQAGIPVPPGYVILSAAFERFLDETNLNVEIDAILGTVQTENMQSVEDASGKIQELILAAKMPEDIAREIETDFKTLGTEFVAVRSSATAEDSASAAWAGQLDTYLNTTEDTLLENVQRCWASLFTPRAIFYRFEKGLHATKISVAVVVQKMVNSDAAGIAFSVHPVTEDHNQIIIEAGFGLGEAVVSGQVTPDSYVVTKEPREIIDKNISEQMRGLYRKEGGGNEWKDIPMPHAGEQVLTDEQVMALAETVSGIEKHYGFPVDTEWAMEDSVIYITQSRPITTLTPPVAKEPPSGTPENFKNAPSAVSAGGAIDPRYEGVRFHKKGRWSTMPLDTETWHTPETSEYFEKRFGLWKEILAICDFDAEYANHMYVPERFVAKLHERIAAMTAANPKAMEETLMHFYEEKESAKKEVPRINPSDPSVLSGEELASVYEKNRARAHAIVIYDQFTWLAEEYWIPLMDAVLIDEHGLAKGSPEYNDALFALIKPREISTTLEEKREVVRHALAVDKGSETVKEAARTLAEEYGWMPVLAYGVPWNAKRYEEEVTSALALGTDSLKKELSELERYTELRDEAFEVVAKKYGIGDDKLQTFIDFGLAIDTRNEAEYVVSVVGFHLLPLYDEIAKRFGISVSELRMLYEREITAALRGTGSAKTFLANRGKFRAWFLDDTKKERIDFTSEEGAQLFVYAESQIQAESASGSQSRRGITANKGKVRGRVKKVPFPEDNHKVETGDIMFSYSTMVDNLPAMKKAAAFVTESGGLTCHAAVVAREFGVPCIVGYRDAMSDFNDGDMVEVDADNGTVRLLERTDSRIFPDINSDTYDFLWQVGRSYFRSYLYYDTGYKGRDFVFTWRPDEDMIFVSKEERKRLGQEALHLYTDGFKDFKERMDTQIPAYEKTILDHLSGDVTKLSDTELKAKFEDVVDTLVAVFEDYFYLEYHSTDEVARIITERDPRYDIDRLIEESEEMGRIKLGLRTVWNYAQQASPNVLKHYLEEIGARLKLGESVERYNHLEILALLSGKVVAPPDRSGLVIWGKFSNDEEIKGAEAERIMNALWEVDKSTREFKGQTGNKGSYTGRVKKIDFSTSTDFALEIGRMQDGDILVSGSTGPEMILAMKKAGAIVTDEGGIISHAAIVSRELGIPSVIGTKVATHLLKDGDLIEVDADKGVVKILEST